jgi:hypothetical protein
VVYFLNLYGPVLIDRLIQDLPIDLGQHWVLSICPLEATWPSAGRCRSRSTASTPESRQLADPNIDLSHTNRPRHVAAGAARLPTRRKTAILISSRGQPR